MNFQCYIIREERCWIAQTTFLLFNFKNIFSTFKVINFFSK